jgi:hypothetical protein
VLGGWQFAGSAIFQTGSPINVTNGAAFPRGDYNADGSLSLSKKFELSPRVSAEVRLDAFNAFNRVNLADPNMDLSNTNFGRSTSQLSPRAFQIGTRLRF